MTVFPDGTKERLHGHNYTVALAVDVARVDLAAMIPFVKLKDLLAELCADWKERVLIPARNPYLEIARDDDTELEFTLCGARYVLPRGDALLLPIDNVSAEGLAAHVAALFQERVAAISPHIQTLEVTIEEGPGQGSSCAIDLR